ncbi:RNA-directed DNA polymerase, eukaryota [Tanacetum coccineum]|uniref:RNA-directed DNA polymerase, eukaryota n=1 Tax=Tanacetum coccineum TaxID=301880 RepID=A0ABQ4X7Y6_9ASTR
MRTRNSNFLNNSNVTIPRRRNKGRAPNIVEPELRTIVAPMAERTMEELLRAPTEGYGEAIVLPEINADHFEIKTNLLQLVQANPFHGLENENPHAHINSFKRITSTLRFRNVPNDVIKLMMFPYSLEGAAKTWYEKEPPNSILTWEDLVTKFVNQFFPPSKTTHLKNKISRFTQKFDESFSEAWERFKEMLRACPHHGFTELTQVDTFYNGLNDNDQDSLNAAAGGNLLSKTTREALNIIENKSKVRYSRNKPNASRMNTTSRENVSKTDERIDKLADQLSTLVEIVSKKVVTPASVKAVEETCVTCGGAHSWYNCPTTDNNQASVCATTGTYNQVNPPNRVSNQMAPPGFAPVQNNGQNRFNQNQVQGNNFNRGNNFHGNQGVNESERGEAGWAGESVDRGAGRGGGRESGAWVSGGVESGVEGGEGVRGGDRDAGRDGVDAGTEKGGRGGVWRCVREEDEGVRGGGGLGWCGVEVRCAAREGVLWEVVGVRRRRGDVRAARCRGSPGETESSSFKICANLGALVQVFLQMDASISVSHASVEIVLSQSHVLRVLGAEVNGVDVSELRAYVSLARDEVRLGDDVFMYQFAVSRTYGHVIDVFIPDRRSKIGKRFGFVRFIKVFDVDRLVGNLCTVWIGKHRLHVNVARFSRPLLKNNRSFVNKEEQMRDKFNGEKKDSAERTSQNSYAYVVKGGFQANGEKDTAPVMVLDDSCVNQQDFSCCLNGKVKEFGALVNLKIVIRNEGFSDVGLKYLGGLWVMLTFNSKEAKEKFLSCVAINTWFAQLIQASSELMVDDRVTWVDIEGIPLKLWTSNTFKKIASRWGTLIDVDKSEDENFHSRRMCILTKGMTNVYETFKINHHGKVYWVRAKEISGWVPDFEEQSDEESDSDSEQSVQGFSEDIDGREEEQQVDDDISVVPDTIGTNARTKDDEGTASKEVMENQSSDPFGIYSLLKEKNRECDVNVHDNIASVDGSSATRCKKDGTESVGSGHIHKVEVPRTGGSILSLMEELIKEGFFVFGILMFSKKNVTVSDYFIMIRGDWLSNGKSVLIISVYAPQELSEKKMLWDYLNHVIVNWKGEVIIMGDFNEVRHKSERFGSSFNVQGAKVFNSFIVNSNLVEVPLGGCSFTWCHSSASKMSKLDRFLISEAFFRVCPSISAITLDRFLSDHRPILLRESFHDFGPIPFRFFHFWLEVDGFEKLIKDVWHEAPSNSSNAMVNLMQKLKFVKNKIRVWNRLRQSDKNRKNILEQELGNLDSIIDKAKIKWAVKGDENSKYFYGILNKKRSQLAIRGVMIDGLWVERSDVVKNEFHNHFRRRFEQPNLVRPVLKMEFSNRLTLSQIQDLEAEVSNEEIKKAVWDCGIDKSPGPDGFTFGFYKKFWDIIESDVVAAVKSFFHSGNFQKGCNFSFITLIPKILDAKLVKDFRPICLIGSLYKIISKILANRLVLVLGNLVNEVQSAFFADRQILDGSFILNEVYQWCKSKRKQSFILKIDFEKAYDSVRWDYVVDVLSKFGFGKRWCEWIHECFRSSRGSVLVNGSPTTEFQFYKGLKQGDPLAPFIFILVMESLHLSFNRVVDAGLFQGLCSEGDAEAFQDEDLLLRLGKSKLGGISR